MSDKLKTVVPELLAPAGDEERLASALQYGADAVYLGGTAFGMRAAPGNFNGEQLKNAVQLCHSKGVKVYLTCNTLPRNDELACLPQFLEYSQECGVDALIIADIGVLSMAKKYAPKVEIHISTQAGIVNYETANAFYNMGATRIVTAREISMNDIAEIRAKTPKKLEIECFVHGAMCVSFSGRCLLSNYLTGRDSNRGDCAQPCRWKYHLVEEKRPGEYYEISDDENGTYIMNARDMCMIEHIPELVKAGVSSFKLEGRAKSAYYTAAVTNAYRAAIDGYLKNPSPDYKPEKWIVDEMVKVSYRDYCTGFYFGHPRNNANVFYDGIYKREWDLIANVISSDSKRLTVEQRNKFSQGDELEVLSPNKKPFIIKAEDLRDENGEKIESAPHPMRTVSFLCEHNIERGSLLRREK
ncbi:MAG: U32 family peptidase [Oscillospiraceae bacterium]